MSFKFNRNCWVESLEERLFCSKAGDETEVFSTNGPPSGENGAAAAEPATVEEMIAGARNLFARYGDAIQKDECIGRLIDSLKTNLENSAKCMEGLGIFCACARCDETSPAGSCCSRGLERKYSPVLLLMNLILGIGLPERRLREDSCYFLGPKGCCLKVRHELCIDYLCPQLEEMLGRESLIKIQTISGEEITSAFLLYEAVKDKTRKLLPPE